MQINDIFQLRRYKAVLRAYTYIDNDGRVWTMPSPFAMPSTESTTITNALRLVQFGSVTAFYNNIVSVSITLSRNAATSITIRMPYESNASKYGTGTHAAQELQVLKPQTFVDGNKYFITPSLFKGSYLYRLDIVPQDAINWNASEADIRAAINSLSDKETYFMYLVDSTINRTTSEKYMELNFVDTSYLFQTNMNISYPEQSMYEKLFKTGKDAELLALLKSKGVYPAVWDGWTLPNFLIALMHYAGMLPPTWEFVSTIPGSEYVDYKVHWGTFEPVVLRVYGDLNTLRLPYSPEYPDPDDTLGDGYYFKTNPYDTFSSMLEDLMQTLGVNWRVNPSTGVLEVFLDSNNTVHEGTLSESLMTSFGYNYNDTNLRNAVTVLGQEYGAGKMYSAYAQNDTSIGYFGRRHMIFQHPLILSDSQAQSIASNILNQYAFNVGSLNIDTLYSFKLKPYDRLHVELSDENITMGTGTIPLLEVAEVSKNLDWLGNGTSRLSLINVVNKVYIPLEKLYGGREIQIEDLSKLSFAWESDITLTDIKSLLTTNIVRVPLGRRTRVAWLHGKSYLLRAYLYSERKELGGAPDTHNWTLWSTKIFEGDSTPGNYEVKELSISYLKQYYGFNNDTWTGFDLTADIESEFSVLCSADVTGVYTPIKYLSVSQADLYSMGVFNYSIPLNYRLMRSSGTEPLKRPILTFIAIPLLNFEIKDGTLIYDMRSLPEDKFRYALLQEVVYVLDSWKKNLNTAPVSFAELPFPEWAGVEPSVESAVSFVSRKYTEYQSVFEDKQTVEFNLMCKESDSATSSLLISRKFLLAAFIKVWDTSIEQYRWVPIGDYVVVDVPPPEEGLILKWNADKFELGVFKNIPLFDNHAAFTILSRLYHDTEHPHGSFVYNTIVENGVVDRSLWTRITPADLDRNAFNYKLKYACSIPYKLSILTFKYRYSLNFLWFIVRKVHWEDNRLELVRLHVAPTHAYGTNYVYDTVDVKFGDLNYNDLAEQSGEEPNVFTLTFVASPFQYYDAHFYLDYGYCLMSRSAVTHGSEPSVDDNTYPAHFWVKDMVVSDRKRVLGVTGFNFN